MLREATLCIRTFGGALSLWERNVGGSLAYLKTQGAYERVVAQDGGSNRESMGDENDVLKLHRMNQVF